MIRRLRSALALALDHVVGPLGWDVLICWNSDQPGIDWFSIRRRPAGTPRARIAGPYRGGFDA